MNDYPDALQLDVRKKCFRTQCFSDGLFEVQDASSQLVAYFMDVKPGMRVIDACAGGGGKTLHIASLMENRGKILAMDVHEWKLKEMQKRAASAEISIIEPRAITSSKVIKRLKKTEMLYCLMYLAQDLVFCIAIPILSGSSIGRALNALPKNKLRSFPSYSNMTQVGGQLFYATCSIHSLENEKIVDQFLSQYPAFEKIAEKKVLPSESGHDGFYMAALKRNS